MAKKDSSDLRQEEVDYSSNNENDDNLEQVDYKAKFEEMQELAMRFKADLDNQQKRFDKEKIELFDMSKKSILFSLIPALDSFYLANSHLPDELKNNSWALGMQAVGTQLSSILSELGITSYSCLGQQFDANRAEAIEEVDDDSDAKPGTVIVELSPGWEIAGNIVRPAKVKVKK